MVLVELLYNITMRIKKLVVAGLVGLGLVACSSPYDKMFEQHGPVVYNECYEDGSCRMEFEDGFFISACVRPNLGCE